MKRILYVLGITLASIQSFAQCPFDPLINENDTIICSGDQITLSTQTYDTIQWYQSFSSGSIGNPIPGANSSTLTVSGFGWYTVEVTLNGCTEAAPNVLVDEYVFLNPVVVSSGQSQFCIGDTSQIAIGTGDWVNIQWYQDGNLIPGATDSLYNVTASGEYVVFASPAVCPNQNLTSGLGPVFTFHVPQVPTISWNVPLLTSSSASSYQWNINGSVMPGETAQTYMPLTSGIYSVTTIDSNGCEATSDTIHITITDIPEHSLNLLITPIGDGQFRIEGVQQIDQLTLFGLNGRLLFSEGRLNTPYEIMLPESAGVYLLQVSSGAATVHKKLAR